MLATALLASALAWAPAPPQEPDSGVKLAPEEMRRSKKPDDVFHLYAYFLTRAEMTNVSPANDLFNGQIVGRLFGPNTTTTSKDRAVFVEQRVIPFFLVEPRITNKKVRLRASFELDWTFGDVSNSVGGNFGGAITADQVNLQTQNLAIEFDLPGKAKNWSVSLGLQRLYDTAYDPYRTQVATMQYTGERLAFWGTDAVGIVVHGKEWGQRFKLGAYQLYENMIQKDDDVALFEFATDRHLGKTWHFGASARYLRDSSNGAGGLGILGQGPDSQLVEYNGGYRFTIPDDVERWRGHFGWLGANASYNPELVAGRLGGSAFLVGNFGQIVTEIPNQPGEFQKLTNVLGVAGNLRLAFRWGDSPRDAITGELLYTSGDHDGLEDGTYNGVVTGNTWGAPAAPFTTFGTYLLMPHPTVVNRLYAAVSDISNAGFGLTAGSLGFGWDIIRHRLLARVGGAAGRSNIQPIEGGNFIGAELNGSLSYRIRPLMHVEAHGAYLFLGDYFKSPEIVVGGGGKPMNPWTVFLALKWLLV
jgi:hypothetical protein